MKILLDTHALLWLITGDSRLSKKASKTFLSSDNRLFFSIASLWEICTKISIGKITMSNGWFTNLKDEMAFNAIQWLPIRTEHCAEIAELPFHHRDPFDRMLIAQAITENFSILSKDKKFSEYGIHCIW